jgi:hypothetical protein
LYAAAEGISTITGISVGRSPRKIRDSTMIDAYGFCSRRTQRMISVLGRARTFEDNAQHSFEL